MYGIKKYHFDLHISKDELMRVYTGSAQVLVVRTYEGVTLQLDANHLRQFTTMQGIIGKFVLTVNAENKFISLKQVA